MKNLCSICQTLIVILLLSACASRQLGTPTTVALPPGMTPIPQSELTATAAAARPTQAAANCSLIPLQQAVLVVKADNMSSLVSLMDPAEGRLLCGYTGLSFPSPISYAFSSDSSRMAVIKYGERQDGTGVLQIVNLETWQAITTTVSILQNVNLLKYNPAGTRLAVVEDLTPFTANPVLAYRLDMVDLAAQKITAQVDLAYTPRAIVFNPSGSTLAVYGVTDSVPEGSQPQAHVQLFEADNLTVLWEPALPGVWAGSNAPKTPGGDPIFNIWEPGTTFSADGSLLYIVHADTDQITRVDFSTHTLAELDIQPQQSWLERMLALGAGTAYAKGENGTRKQAALSPDGKVLYVVGMRSEATQDSRGNFQLNLTPLGLQKIDAPSGRLLGKLEVKASTFWLAASGERLYLNNWYDISTADLVEANSLKVIQHLENATLMITRRLDGEPILLQQTQAGQDIRMVDAQTLTPLGNTWKMGGYPFYPFVEGP